MASKHIVLKDTVILDHTMRMAYLSINQSIDISIDNTQYILLWQLEKKEPSFSVHEIN